MSGGGFGRVSWYGFKLPWTLSAPSVSARAMYVPRVGVAPSPVCFQSEECVHLPLLPLCVCVSEWYALPPRLGVLLGAALG